MNTSLTPHTEITGASWPRQRRSIPPAAGVVLIGATLMLSGCGGDGGRDAKSVSATNTGQIVSQSRNDYDSIIIGWGREALARRNHHALARRRHRTVLRERR